VKTLHVLPCLGGIQRIDHKLDLSPCAHYIVKHIKNEVMRSLEENVFMNYRWFSHSLVILALEFTCMFINTHRDQREKEEKTKIKARHKNNKQNKRIPLLISTMAETRKVHRCHAQYKPLSLLKIKRKENLT